MEIKKNHASDFLMSKDFVKELEQPDSQSRIAVYESFFQYYLKHVHAFVNLFYSYA